MVMLFHGLKFAVKAWWSSDFFNASSASSTVGFRP